MGEQTLERMTFSMGSTLIGNDVEKGERGKEKGERRKERGERRKDGQDLTCESFYASSF